MDLAIVTAADAAARLGQLPQWHVQDGQLCRTWRTTGWRATLMVANAIGFVAEAAWHHPDLRLSYASVEVRLSTHDAGGLTARDFELAARIEHVVSWHPGGAAGGSALDGPPAEAALLAR